MAAADEEAAVEVEVVEAVEAAAEEEVVEVAVAESRFSGLFTALIAETISRRTLIE